MRIAITGGKGGTGKSMVATALAVELAKSQKSKSSERLEISKKFQSRKKVLLIDADVGCPNDHLILNIKMKKEKDVFQPIPVFDFKKCIKCGKCSEVCKEAAIVFVKDKFPIFIPEQCIGCSACLIACPQGAISKGKKKVGTIYSGKNYGVEYLSAETEVGLEEESPVVNGLKNFVKEKKENYGFVLVDTASGVHCQVISALMSCEIALAVTEPTPLGAHDLELILRLLKILKIKFKVVLNKATIGNKKLIEKIVKKYKTEIIAEIPYRKEILKAYSRGKPIKEENIDKIVEYLEKIEWKS